MRLKIILLLFCFVSAFLQHPASAQVNRAQYPRFLSRSYIGVNVGYIDYPFTSAQFEPGFSAESIKVPHLALQVLLLGYHITDKLSAQITYTRPVNWVEYRYVNGDQYIHYVWMNLGGLTAKYRQPLSKKFSAYAEGGLGIITRKGFRFGQVEVIKDASYAAVVAGTGIQYKINKNWDLRLSMLYSPKKDPLKQPYTVFYSTGFNYNMQALSEERVKTNSGSGFIFPKQLIQAGYSTNHFTYGANNFVSEGKIPIFWGGEAEVQSGFSLQYLRNVFHGRKLFSLDLGTGFSSWRSNIKKENFFTLSVFPVFRFTFLRTKPADMYFYYSVAGPTYISRTVIDSVNTGKHFTFQDLMGMGIFAGKKRQVNAEVRIGHYSNGNIFPDNEGVKVPLTFNLGFAF